jgi:hypothetical protein
MAQEFLRQGPAYPWLAPSIFANMPGHGLAGPAGGDPTLTYWLGSKTALELPRCYREYVILIIAFIRILVVFVCSISIHEFSNKMIGPLIAPGTRRRFFLFHNFSPDTC